MIALLIPSFFLFLFATFNLFGIKSHLVPNQIIFFVIGSALFFFIRFFARPYIKLHIHRLYWIFVALLLLTFFIGLEVKGSRRWIDLPFFNFQPSEFFKIIFVFFLANFFSQKYHAINNAGIFVVSLLYLILPVSIIFLQPDFGTSTVYVVGFLSVVLFSKVPKKYLAMLLFFFLILIPIMWPFLKSYQRDRILSFIHTDKTQHEESYNMIQAVITTGSGQFVGRGLGLGTQSRLYFLPENHTDFAFSSLIEQFGFIAGFIVFILYAVILTVLMRRLWFHLTHFDQDWEVQTLYIVGFSAMFVFQIVINTGMNMGLLPIAGITLPFISYGGSSFLTLLLGLALVN